MQFCFRWLLAEEGDKIPSSFYGAEVTGERDIDVFFPYIIPVNIFLPFYVTGKSIDFLLKRVRDISIKRTKRERVIPFKLHSDLFPIRNQDSGDHKRFG